MSSQESAAALFALAAVILSAQVAGALFERIHQPRLVGEILAGALLGPFAFGRLAPGLRAQLFGGEAVTAVLDFVEVLGLALLMFCSGSQVRKVLSAENRRATAWLLSVGTPLPFFLALGVGLLLPLERISGPSGQRASVLLVLAIAVAVTSLPVITRIFHDLGILHTRFASLVLGVAILEDLALWAVLAVATALARGPVLDASLVSTVSSHVGLTVAFLIVGLGVGPLALRWLFARRWNLLARSSPVAWALVVLFAACGLASTAGVNPIFAAFLSGFALVGGISGSERERFAPSLEVISQVAYAAIIPVYFFKVGARLELGLGFDPMVLATFLLGSSLLCLISVALASRLAGFRGLSVVNLAVASNARGGPGIVLASVAHAAGIINGGFFTALVLTAVVTSQAAGWWLGHVLRRGWPLLTADAASSPPSTPPEPSPSAHR
jgi:Kef-type K+ transport system membrane component KefB